MKKIIIIPSCSDLNRGDQALVWETKKIAEESGHTGEFYFLTEKNEPVSQSEKKGLIPLYPILEHPSRRFKNKNNIKYSKMLKFAWGSVAIFDFLGSLLILWKFSRPIAALFLNNEKRKTLETYKSADVIFMKGGGLLQTYGGFTSTYSMYFWTYPILLAHALKKPVYVMPNSFGPFEGPFVKTIAKSALGRCKLLTSRETISQKMVKNDLGLDIDNYPDLAFDLPKSNLSKKEIFEKYNLPTNKKLVAITMRPYRFPNADNPDEAYKHYQEEMRTFIEWLFGNGYMPVIVKHTLAVNAHEDDGECISSTVRPLDNSKYRLVENDNFNCEDLKKIYSFCDYIVGTRFHSLIFSFGSNIPGIAISYTGNKSTGIMHDMELDDYVIQIDQIDSATLIEKFQKLVSEHDIVVEKIVKYRKYSELSRKKLVEESRS